MPRGGKREGAGRKAGVPNKASPVREARVAATGQTPLDYMLQVMRNKRNPRDVRLEAARAAGPYVHPRLATLQSNVKLSGQLTLEQLVANSIPIEVPKDEPGDAD